MPPSIHASRPSPRSLLLVPLAALTVPALVAGFLLTLLALVGRPASPDEPHLALVLVSTPLAILLLAVSASLLRARGREVSALRRDVSATERTLVTLVDTADDAVVTTDTQGRITGWNRGAERLYAAPRNAAVGRSLTDFVAADGVRSAEETLGRVVGERGRARVEAVHRRLDGTTFDAAAAFSAIIDDPGETIGVSVIVRDVTERNLALRRLADSQRRLQLITDSAADAMFTADDRGRLVSWNPAAERIFGWTEAQAAGRTIMDMIVPPLDDETRSARPVFGMDAWRRLAGRTIAVEGIRSCGTRFPAELSAATYDHAGRSWFAGFVRDTTDRVRAEALAEELLARYQQLVERMPGVVYRARVGRGNHPDYVSPHVQPLLGYSPEEWMATPGMWRSRIHPEDLERVLSAVDAVEARVTEGGVETDDIEYRMLCRDGRIIWVRDHGSATRDRRGVAWNGILFDVTERKSLEAQLVHQAFHDPLTGLANRALLGDRIGHAVRRADRGDGLVALLMLDLDDFKAVNDTLGHAAGDQLLRAVAERLRLEVRAGSTVARLGGDEFAILLEDVDEPDGAVAAAERIIRSFDQPFRIGAKPVTARASIGVAVDTARKRSASWLLRSADLAMYEAKRRGKGRWQLYDPAAYLAASKRLVLENDLRRAVERQQFALLYQPVVELATQRIVGAEALLRLNHRTLGLVAPSDFISILEATGLIVEVGAWVLDAAARQGAQWAAAFPGFRSMAVNVSARQLADDAFPATVAAALREHGIDPRVLLLEVTESVALDPADATGRRLEALRDLGVRLAVDDFGTGYSSLSYLRRLPMNTLKIDRTFVEGVGDDPEAAAVARAIVELARTLRLTTVAEGIETPDQAAALEAMGCELGQGYLFARPLPAAELASRLVNQAGQVLVA